MTQRNEGLPSVWPFPTYKGQPLPESQRQRQQRILQQRQREHHKATVANAAEALL